MSNWIRANPSRTGEPPANAGEGEAELIARARTDRRAFAPLYDRYLDPVYRYCYRRLGSREAAEDATGEVFYKALAALPGYRDGSFAGWLMAIARNVTTDVLRRRRPEELVKVAASLEPVPGSHAPLPDLGPLEPRAARPTPTPVPAPKFNALRPAWLPEQMAVREQYEPDPTGKGSQLVIGFDPRPEDARPHDVLTLTEMSKGAMPSGARPDPEETRETMGGRDVRVTSRGENWITLTWVQGEVALTLTNPYDPPGQPRYTPEQLRKIVESIR
ncbi:MAG: RNA polymerase sigma factor [Chloroflexota bacterium]